MTLFGNVKLKTYFKSLLGWLQNYQMLLYSSNVL